MAKENGGETSSPEKKDRSQEFKGSKDRGKGKGKGKGRGKGKDRDEKPAPVNPALVRGPRPVKMDPPKEEAAADNPADAEDAGSAESEDHVDAGTQSDG